jgi:hypothetical protein
VLEEHILSRDAPVRRAVITYPWGQGAADETIALDGHSRFCVRKLALDYRRL